MKIFKKNLIKKKDKKIFKKKSKKSSVKQHKFLEFRKFENKIIKLHF